MPSSRKTSESDTQDELAKRGVLSHMEHIKSIGEALTKAVDTYLAGQKTSEAEGDWEDDFAFNVTEASKEFHRSASASQKKVHDIYFAEDKKEPTTKPNPPSGQSGKSRELKEG
jgi:hypothetical protein